MDKISLPKPFRHHYHHHHHHDHRFFTLFLLLLTVSTAVPNPVESQTQLHSDAVSLLKFKLKADTNNKLLYNHNDRFDYCQWQGVKCVQGRVVRFVLQSCGLSGTFADNTLAHLDQLRVLSLRNNSLTGPIPDLSTLTNLKALFLDHNTFAGTFPVSLVSLHRLQSLDLARNNLSGSLPIQLSNLDRLNNLRLEWNRFTGSLPPLNQTTLQVLNVSDNNLAGPIPAVLSRFDASAFLLNLNLCGKVVSRLIIHIFIHLNLGKMMIKWGNIICCLYRG
ncbi:putative non-specific serine/threonine protein kinase [Helianthus annuus]|nr:putative non-specific serine/threonine protein kinase [Helianthus annuus]